jgi:glycine hydroxymethyltransferase
MVPFDSRSPFQTSGIRVGTPAITTRGFVESDMAWVVGMINEVIENHKNEEKLNSIKHEVENLVKDKPLFAEVQTI